MDKKNGFNLFGKKELPNQSNDIANLNANPQPEVNQTQINEQNAFEMPAMNNSFQEAQPKVENTPNVFEQSFNTQAEMPELNNTDFNNMNQGDFSTQSTEPTIENQLATPEPSMSQPRPQQPTQVATPKSVPESEAVSAPAPEPGTINTLNNLGTYNVDLKETAKKELNKKTFLIVVAVAILLLCITGMVTGGPSKLFGKAPNEITVPGENEDDPSNKVENPEENENESGENGETEEDESGANEEEEVVEEPTSPNGNTSVSGGSINDTVVKQEHTQIKNDSEFDTLVENPSTLILSSNQEVAYEVRQDGFALNILQDGNVVSYIDMTPTDDEAIDGVAIYATGHISNNYILIKVHKNYDFGDFYILDKNFQIMESGKYDLESEPIITQDAIYFGKVNCNGKRSDNKQGPVVEVFKFDSKKGTKQYRYSIDYNDEFNKCS